MSREKILNNVEKLTEIGKRFKFFENNIGLKSADICKLLNIRDSYLSDLKYGRMKKGGLKFWDGIRQKFPEWESYLRCNTDIPPIKNDIEKKEIQNITKKVYNSSIIDEKKSALDTYELHTHIVEHLLRAMLSDSRIRVLEEKCNDLTLKVKRLEKRLPKKLKDNTP